MMVHTKATCASRVRTCLQERRNEDGEVLELGLVRVYLVCAMGLLCTERPGYVKRVWLEGSREGVARRLLTTTNSRVPEQHLQGTGREGTAKTTRFAPTQPRAITLRARVGSIGGILGMYSRATKF